MLPNLFQQEYWSIVGLIVLSIFGMYCLRLVSTFRNGLFSKCWKQVTAGAIFLIAAQFPLIGSQIGSSNLKTPLVDAAALMRLAGVILIIIGLRAQTRIWRVEDIRDTQKEIPA
jgi:hypothetical protein